MKVTKTDKEELNTDRMLVFLKRRPEDPARRRKKVSHRGSKLREISETSLQNKFQKLNFINKKANLLKLPIEDIEAYQTENEKKIMKVKKILLLMRMRKSLNEKMCRREWGECESLCILL